MHAVSLGLATPSLLSTGCSSTSATHFLNQLSIKELVWEEIAHLNAERILRM
jgi:hypothetical protein